MVDFGLTTSSDKTPPPVVPASQYRESGLVTDNVAARQDRHENRSRRTHLLIGLALLILAILMGRAAYDNWQLRKGTDGLRDAVAEQSLKLAQVGDISAYLGEDFVKTGTVLTGPDGQQFVCAPEAGTTGAGGTAGQAGTSGTTGTAGGAGAAGTAGAGGTAGAAGTVGTQGPTGPQGPAGAAGVTGPQGIQGSAGNVALIDMDDTYSNFSGSAIVNIDNAEGQGNLRFNVSGSAGGFDIQANGTSWVRFDIGGDTSIGRALYVGRDDLSKDETIANAGFTIDDNDLYIEGMAGVDGRIFTNLGLTVGSTTTYDDGAISATGDLSITAADDMTITASGGNIATFGVVNHSILKTKNGPIVRLTNVASAQSADLVVGSKDPSSGGIINDEGSLFLRDNTGTGLGELWISDGAGVWRQIATTSGSSATDINEAYDNFVGGLSGPAVVVIDGAQGQGNLRFNLADVEDFVIMDAGNAFATFSDSGNLALDPSTAATEALTITQTTTGNGIDITGAVNSGHLINIINPAGAGGSSININDSSGNTGIQVTGGGISVSGSGISANNTGVGGIGLSARTTNATSTGILVDYEASSVAPGLGPLVVTSESDTVTLSGSTAAHRAALLIVDANTDDLGAYNFIALNSDVDNDGNGADAEWRVQQDGATFADGAYNAVGADFAEYFTTKNDTDLVPGEIVAADPDGKGQIKRAEIGDNPIGVVSSSPSFIGNNKAGVSESEQPTTNVLVGLIGQVQVRVGSDGSSIMAGDYVTIGLSAGTAKRAAPNDPVVGLALGEVDASGTVPVLLGVERGGNKNDSSSTPLTVTGAKDAILTRVIAENVEVSSGLKVEGNVIAGSLLVADSATITNGLQIGGHLTVATDTAGSVEISKGSDNAKVSFKSPYQSRPMIFVTPQTFGPRFITKEVSADGFTIQLETIATAEMSFDWFAVATAADIEKTTGLFEKIREIMQ
ncbi:MAG: peptidase G2 autoproteolytic cleavage domain-containing protein [Parcubacteria group bacterium]